MDENSLRSQLTLILKKTADGGKLSGGGFWVGDTAGERRVLDDLQSGRLQLHHANSSASGGLRALEQGDVEIAEAFLTNAIWLYIEALEKSVRPSDRLDLGKQTKRRGRHRKTDTGH